MKRKSLVGLFIVIGLAGLVLIGASVDFAGDLVVREADKAVKELMGADLNVAGISGNPIKGFTTGKITLSEEGRQIFSAGFLEVKINLMSLFSKSPKVSVLSVGGVDMDADALAEQVAQMKFEGGGGGEIPIETFKIVDSVVRSRWGRADISDIALSFAGKEIQADMDMAVNGIPVNGKTTAVVDGKNVDISSLSVNVGKGSISASGRVAPSLAVSGNIRELDLKELIAFWPVVPADGFDGKVSAGFKGEGEWNTPVLAGDIDYSGKSILGYPVESVKAKWTLSADKLAVTDIDARILAMPLEGGLSVAFAKDKAPAIDLALSGTGIKMAELKKLYPAMGEVSGEIEKFTINASGTADALQGAVHFSAPSLGAFGFTVADSAAQVKIAPKTATINAKTVFEGAPAFVQGTVSDYMSAPKLDLTANIRSFNLARAASLAPAVKEFALSGAVDADFALKGAATAPNVSGKIWSKKVSAMKETIESPSVSFGLKGSAVSISSASAKWRGAALSASGTVSAGQKLNITAELKNIQPGALAPFYPDIAQFKIKGAANAKAVVTGNAASPKIDLTISSASLGLLDSVSLKNLSVATSLSGDLKNIAGADLDLDVGADSAALEGLGLTNLSVKLKKTGQKVTINSASAKSGKGSISASGGVTLGAKPGDEGSLDLNVKVSGADLASLAKTGGLAVPLGGALDGTVTVKGAFSNPSISVKAASPRVTVSGLAASNVSLGLSGSMKEMKIDEFKSGFGGGTLSGTGNIKLGASPDVTVDISGSELDLGALTSGMPDAKELHIAGKVNASFKGRFAGASGKGQGSITSPSLTVMGLKASNLSYPVSLEGNTLWGKGASVNFYGGKITGSGSLDISTLKFSHSAQFSGVDINGVVQDFTGGMGGKITGQAKGSANVSGSFGPKFAVSGKGNASVGSGAVTGFKAVDIVAKLYGSSGIRYADVSVPFRIETGRIILDKGTRVNAPKNDTLYKFLTAEGPIGPKGTLKLQCAGNVNIQLINALTGGAVGGLTAGALEDVLKGIVGGAQKGMSAADFRDVSFSLGGTMEKPGVSNLKVAKGAQQTAPADTKPAEQPKPVPQPAKTPEQAILEKIIKPKPAPAPAPAPAPKPEPKKPEDILKEKLLESIFKK
jgi:translocation and assembly module TamB